MDLDTNGACALFRFATLKKHNVPVPKHVIISDNPAEGEYHWDDIEEHENALTLKVAARPGIVQHQWGRLTTRVTDVADWDSVQ